MDSVHLWVFLCLHLEVDKFYFDSRIDRILSLLLTSYFVQPVVFLADLSFFAVTPCCIPFCRFSSFISPQGDCHA